MAEVDDVAIGVGDSGYRYQHYLIPIIRLSVFALAIGDEIGDVAIVIAIVCAIVDGIE